MQLSILGVCAILAIGARTAVIKQGRDTVAAKINWFRSLGCDDLVGEGSATLTEVLAGKTDGDCVAVSASSRPMRSIKVTDLYKTCTGKQLDCVSRRSAKATHGKPGC